jgi:hypothetical protein
VSDIDTVSMGSLIALDPNRPIREADIAKRDWHVRFGQILLQKFAMTARGGCHELLEVVTAHYSLPSEGWSGSAATALCARYEKHTSATGGEWTTSLASLRRF